jgi:hypothetical protein
LAALFSLGRLALSLLVLITVSVIILPVVLQLQVAHKTWPAKKNRKNLTNENVCFFIKSSSVVDFEQEKIIPDPGTSGSETNLK